MKRLLEWVGASLPSISKIARRLVKRRPCCKRSGHGLFCARKTNCDTDKAWTNMAMLNYCDAVCENDCKLHCARMESNVIGKMKQL